MADQGIKPEFKEDPADIKEGIADVDEFEEDTDLQIPQNPPQGWLARVPPELWQAWSDMYNDAPALAGKDKIKIGSLRVYDSVGGKDQELELHLDENIQATKEMPKKYQLKLQTAAYNNSVVFSEKDLPGHKSQTYGRNRHNAAKSGGINKNDRFNNNNNQPVKRIAGYSSVIPKQTALAAKVHHEANLVPVEDAEYYKSLERTLTQAMQPKVNTNIQSGMVRGMQPGQQSDAFSKFTTAGTTPATTKGKKKAVKEKAVRMSQAEMYDAIHRCFREYKYWSLKALRHRLNQPEVFIKSSLENIGHLIRSGDFAMQYVLNPDYAASLDIKDEDVIADAAKVESGDDDSGDEAEDDDMEMEDVKMES
ncbi:hypothetical protein Q7P37_009493 [Cladosporium fusiforme]